MNKPFNLLATLIFGCCILIFVGCRQSNQTSTNLEINKNVSVMGTNQNKINQSVELNLDSESEEVKQTVLKSVKEQLVNSNLELKVLQTLTLDFDGDGDQDSAVLLISEEQNRLFVSFILSPFSNDSAVYFEEFGIDGTCQQCICELEKDPLTVEELDIRMIKIYWNIKISRITQAKGLNLNGGGCDGVHLFWISETEQVGWWRR